MNLKTLLLGMVVLLSQLLACDAMARVCLLRSASGSCTFWSGSVECEDLNANGIGNVKKNPTYMACSVLPPPLATEVEGMLFCSNGGGNVAPGVQAFVVNGFKGLATITPSQVDKNGFASGINVKASIPPSLLGPNPADPSLAQYCQNSNWWAVDFVPSSMSVDVNVLDSSGTVVDTEHYLCTLPHPETLTWDKFAKRPERREYDCTKQ